MPQIFAVGETLYTDRMLDRADPAALAATNAPPRRLRTMRGTAELPPPADLEGTPFEPLGIGKPLAVEIAYVYTGTLPGNSRSDMLLASAVKRLPVFDAAPRAINALLKSVPSMTRVDALPAVTSGTPLVYYTPGLTDHGLTVTLEMVFDRFPEETFERIGSVLGTAAGIPVFAPASAYLMAGSLVLKVVAKIAERVLDGSPDFAETLSIDMNRPGLRDTRPGYVLLTNSPQLESQIERGELIFRPRDGLVVKATITPYTGPVPYIVLSLDGHERPDYAEFAPTMASAAVLDRFLHTGDRPRSADVLIEGLKAYNDIHYADKAESLARQLGRMTDPGSAEFKRVKSLFDAYVKNIGDERLRPKLG